MAIDSSFDTAMTSSISFSAVGFKGAKRSGLSKADDFIVLATSKSTVVQSFIDFDLSGAISIWPPCTSIDSRSRSR